MRQEKIYIVHPDVDGLGSCLPSALRYFKALGWTEAPHSLLPEHLQPPTPPEPQFVVSYDELVPAEEPGLTLVESGWTEPATSEKATKKAADKTKES